MKAVVVLGGAPPPEGEARAEVAGARVVAADAGGAHCLRWGVVPEAVVGDMDSLAADALALLEARGARVVRHARDKLHTDARLALDHALAWGPDEVVFLAAGGGRPDQWLANVQLLRRAAEAGAAARGVDAEARTWIATPARPATAALAKGAVFSVLALTDRATGVTVAGARWPLAEATMESVDPYGVSNVAEGQVRVACASGVLAVVAPR